MSKFEGLMFFRCCLCRRVVSPWDIEKEKGCAHCGHTRISPSNLTLIELIVQIVKHPKVWKWKEFGELNSVVKGI